MTMDCQAVSVDLPRTAPIMVPPTDHDLTVILPAFNEEKRLPWTLKETHRLSPTMGHRSPRAGGR